MSADQDPRRFPVVGGVAAWRVPLLTAPAALSALALDARDVAVGAAVLGYLVHGLWRSSVLEVSAGRRVGALSRCLDEINARPASRAVDATPGASAEPLEP